MYDSRETHHKVAQSRSVSASFCASRSKSHRDDTVSTAQPLHTHALADKSASPSRDYREVNVLEPYTAWAEVDWAMALSDEVVSNDLFA